MFAQKVRQSPAGGKPGLKLKRERILIMAITGNSSYIPTMNEFIAHWTLCNAALNPQTLTIQTASNTTVTIAQFTVQRDALQSQLGTIQACLTAQQIARTVINSQKEALLAKLALFNGMLDAYYRKTDFYESRPAAPSLTDGQEVFSRPMFQAMSLWEKINASVPPPAGVTLPLTLPDTTTQGTFASAVSALQFAYADLEKKVQDTALARTKRNRLQDDAYDLMKRYRDTVRVRLTAHPDLINTLPRLTPQTGHTPAPVNASAVFQTPNSSKVVYDASTEALLLRYELRGNVGDHYSEEDAIVIASREPNEPREFVTTFGLTQPGAEIALKVYVVLSTGNEAGSAAMLVERPASVELLAA